MNQRDYSQLLKLEAENLITIRDHPTLPFQIFNYTAKTQYNKVWNKYTKICRGLILDENFNVIAKPLSKFFNLNETHESTLSNLPSETPIIIEKLDGVFGILYPENNQPAISSRGSFTSPYALWATSWIRENNYSLSDFNSDYTYCFEIVYPESRIVVDYKNRSELVLLAVINKYDSSELCHVSEAKRLGLTYAKEQKFNTILEAEKHLSKSSGIKEEGFVIKYPNNLRIKIKSPDYRQLHKTITGINSKAVWEILSQNKSIDSLISILPDEYHTWLEETESSFKLSHKTLMSESYRLLSEIQNLSTRKEQALHIKSSKEKNIVFLLLDEQPEKANIKAWNLLKPKSEKKQWNTQLPQP